MGEAAAVPAEERAEGELPGEQTARGAPPLGILNAGSPRLGARRRSPHGFEASALARCCVEDASPHALPAQAAAATSAATGRSSRLKIEMSGGVVDSLVS